MSVQELIDSLNKVEDKSKQVKLSSIYDGTPIQVSNCETGVTIYDWS